MKREPAFRSVAGLRNSPKRPLTGCSPAAVLWMPSG
jgi:hypothetical protein